MQVRQQVFISYNSVDTDFAHQLCLDLQKIGIQTWIAPESIPFGEHWLEHIDKAFQESSHVIGILTPEAMASNWVKRELYTAMRLDEEDDIKFIPVQLRPVKLSPLLANYQKVSFVEDYQDGLEQLKTVFNRVHLEFKNERSEGGYMTGTPIGQVMVTKPATEQAREPANEGLMDFIHPEYQFRLSWPKSGKWFRNAEMEQETGADFILMYHKDFANFHPNVNVVTVASGNLKIREAMEKGNQDLENLGYSIQFTAFDDLTQSGLRIARNETVPHVLYQIQREIIHRGLQFVITGSKLEAEFEELADLYEDMRQVINSFKVLK